jgi:muramoyltetrapeptide carboxypeptidase LdcA involved in peptidoglycan recycling/RimJ/RimL family protein N-acetyltransferase
MILREINGDDAKIIAGWHRDKDANFLYQWAGKTRYTYPLTPQQLIDRKKSQDCEIYIIEDHQDPIGIIELAWKDYDKGIMRFGSLLINENKRGLGYGRKAIDLIEAKAFDDHKATSLELGVYAFNTRAMALYKALNYKVIAIKEDPSDPQWHSYTMAKEGIKRTKKIKQIKPLKKGDAIGIFSPSTPITSMCPNRYKRAKDFLQSKGFKLVEGKLTGQSDYYRSGTIEERAEELNDLIRNPEVRCIMSTIGGMNSNSILPYIDYDAFENDPKIIIGYSDVTAILFAIYAKTGISTFYGPALVASFGELEPYNELTYKYFEDILMTPLLHDYHYQMPEVWTDEFIDWESQSRSKEPVSNQWLTRKDGCVQGRLIIGNLNTMSGIWGSAYIPDILTGDILFIEDSLKDAATVERAFSLLKLNGVFDRIGGLILGKHELFKDSGTGRKPYEILEEVLGNHKIPFLAEVDCCHTHPMFTMAIGKVIRMDATHKRIDLVEKIF